MNYADEFIHQINVRLHNRNQNWLAIICGEPGSGKSYAALSIAEKIGGNITVVFSPKQFMEAVNSGDLKKGDTLIFDEAGVGLAARDWNSKLNKLLGSVLQTFRNKNIACIFTTPSLSFVDKIARTLFHVYLEAVNRDDREKICYLKINEFQHNSLLGKTYNPRPKFVNDEGVKFIVTHIGIPKASDALCLKYESMKEPFTKELNLQVQAEMNIVTEPKVNEADREDKVVKQVLKNRTKYLKLYAGKEIVDYDKLMIDFPLTYAAAKRVKRKIQERI